MFQTFATLAQVTADQVKKLTSDSLELVKKAQALDVEEKCESLSKWLVFPNVGTPSGASGTKAVLCGDEPEMLVIRKEFLVAPPGDWEDTTDLWSRLTVFSMQCAGSCGISPSEILESEVAAGKLCSLLGVGALEDLPSPPVVGLCSPAEDLVQWVLSQEAVHQLQSSLVPRLVSDDQYWVNVVWRFRLYQMCRSAFQLLDVMEVVATRPGSATGSEATGGVPNGGEICWEGLRCELNERRELSEWVKERCAAAQAEADLASTNLQLLNNLIRKGEVTELGNSVLESCKYHKTKLGRLIGAATEQPERLRDSVLCSEGGSLFAKLLSLNEELVTAITAYASLPKDALRESTELAPAREDSPCPNVQLAVEKQNSDDAVFVAALPWETDVE